MSVVSSKYDVCSTLVTLVLYLMPCFLTRPAMNISVNETDIERVRYHFSRVRITVTETHNALRNRLWCHHKNVTRASETRNWCVKFLCLIVIYGLIMPCKKWNNVHVRTVVANCLYAYSSVILVFLSHSREPIKSSPPKAIRYSLWAHSSGAFIQ